ncbi:MAG: DUF1116 domain-containing protein, partial [Anaerolineaceae bacterium]
GMVTHLDWRPPAEGNHENGLNLARLINHPRIEEANQTAFSRFLEAQPVLRGVGMAVDTLPSLGKRTILHAGPPIGWQRMGGPMKGAIIGAILYEGWAATREEAEQYAAGGQITYAPCHHYGAVGPMAGVISPSMPVWIVENKVTGQKGYSNLNEGLGKVLRFGANDQTVLDRLKWMKTILAPALDAALNQLAGIELRPLIAQALHMGDECHNRNTAASALLLKRLAPALLRIETPKDDIAAVFDFITGNDHFFLNISMAACKTMLDAAHGVEGSTLVTAMARNGVDFGIRVSGTGDTWFTAPAPMVEGLLFPGFTKEDAAPDLGDSAITETAGIGGFAMGGAPAIVQFVGGTPADAIAYTREMFHITMGINGGFTSPALNFSGLPAGIDARKVVDNSIQPVINTGIAHREAGVGQVGAGVTRAPMQ